jgi:hypothetical protein
MKPLNKKQTISLLNAKIITNLYSTSGHRVGTAYSNGMIVFNENLYIKG